MTTITQTTVCVVHEAYAADDTPTEIPPARFGPLCGHCYGRTRWMLRQTPQLIAHIRSHVAPGVQAAAYGAKVSGSKERRLPIREQAVEDADDLFSQLGNWMLTFAKALGVTGPYSTLPYDGEQGVTRLPPFALEQGPAFRAVENLVEWYERRELRIIEGTPRDDVRVWYQDLAEYTSTLYARYPEAPRRPRDAKPRVCPVCESTAVRAVFLAAGVEVRCSHCEWTADPTEVEKYVDWSEA